MQDRLADACHILQGKTLNFDLPKHAALADGIPAVYSKLHARGVLHGDVSEDNWLVDHNSNFRVLDFGASKITGDERLLAEELQEVERLVSLSLSLQLSASASFLSCLVPELIGIRVLKYLLQRP